MALDPLAQAARVGSLLGADWLAAESGAAVAASDEIEATTGTALTSWSVNGAPALAAIVPLFDVVANAETLERKLAAEERLATLGLRDVVLWTPPHAPLPDDSGDHFVGRVAEAAQQLASGERGEVGFPVKLGVRRTGNDGSYLNVLGGLHPHWARFTNQVFGQYQLDSSEIHRLPEDPAEVTKLVDFIVLVANGVRSVGKSTTVDTDDVWTLQRLSGLSEPAVLAAAPSEPVEEGREVRKALRRGVRAATEAFAQHEAAGRVIVFLGIVRQMEEELAGIALRGMDPDTLEGLDAVCLVADGTARGLLGPRAGGLTGLGTNADPQH